MNLQNIFTELENQDPEVFEKTSSRRKAMKEFSNFAGKVAVASIPFALGSMFKKAYGQTPSDIIGVLNYALTLEYLESEFYKKGVGTANLIPAGTPAVGALTKIRDDENAHVAFLRTAITAAGGTPVTLTAASFDFTAGGAFPTVFSNYDLFLAVAQTFEDTGVRAYKGQAANLMSNNDVLTAALNIHSVEARHASHIRYMRRARQTANPGNSLYVGDIRPWITLNSSNIGSTAVQASYNGEEATMQAGVNIRTVGGINLSAEAASGAFD
ncbi:MAG: ferritin-like domain-containing protein, partial [Chitinophagaceae bacterium]